MTAVLIIPLCFADAGQGTWLAYAFGTVMLLFVVFCLNQFAKRSALPGSMYGYTAKGLGPAAGVMSGWSLIWCYPFIGVAGLTGFSIFAAQVVSSMGIHTTIPPVIFFCISAAVCWLCRLQGHQDLLALDPVLRGALGHLHHCAGLRDPVQTRLHRSTRPSSRCTA